MSRAALVIPGMASVSLPLGGSVSVIVTEEGTPVTGSLKVITSVSPCSSFPSSSVALTAITTGGAASAGAVLANPVAVHPPAGANETLNEPTAVLAAPPPSVNVSVALVPDTAAEDSVAPEGPPVTDQPVLHEAPRAAEKTALTWSTLPLALVSVMASVVKVTGGGAVVVVVEDVDVVVLDGVLELVVDDVTGVRRLPDTVYEKPDTSVRVNAVVSGDEPATVAQPARAKCTGQAGVGPARGACRLWATVTTDGATEASTVPVQK